MREEKTFELFTSYFDGGSSNGRTTASEAVYPGSNPGPPASLRVSYGWRNNGI